MGDFLAGPFGSWVRVFLGMVVAAVLATAQAGSVGELGTLEWWQATIGAALGALVPIIIAYFNSSDSRFGRGSPEMPVAESS